MKDVRNLIPKDKFDTSTTEKLMSLEDDAIDTIIPELLKWIQDMNWPVASHIIRVFVYHRAVTETYLPDLLKPEQTDEEWKYNIIAPLLMKWPSKPCDNRIVGEIMRIAECPTVSEKEDYVDEAAKKYLDAFDKNNFS